MNKKSGNTWIWLCFFVFVVSLIFAPAQSKKAPTKIEEDPLQSLSLNSLRIRSIGPALTSGRISDFAVNPNKPLLEFRVESGQRNHRADNCADSKPQ